MARKLVFDRVLFATVLVLTIFGLAMVYSASAGLVRDQGRNALVLRQMAAAAIGFGAMVAMMYVDYRWLRRPAVVYALVGAALMMLVAVLFGPAMNASQRWLFVAGLSMQPSELAKLILVVFVAYQIDRKLETLDGWPFLVPVSLATAMVAGLILAGRDLGTAALICLPPLVMIVLAGVRLRFLFAGGLALLPLLIGGIALAPYRMRRVVAFLNPEDDRLGSGFQLLQSLIAVGSGGVLGRGPGASVQKLYFLPSPHADFIFSIVAEELGMIGALFVVALFAVICWRGVTAGLRAPDTFGRYLAWGLTALLTTQALIHMSVALGMLPSTGLPLPLVSHGGSSLVVSLAACGLILNVSQHGTPGPVNAWIEP